MSNLIDFLERLGQDAELRYATGERVDAALRAAGIEPELRAMILAKDQLAIAARLGADTNVCCLVHQKDDEEEEEQEEEEEEEGKEEKDQLALLDLEHVADRAA